MSWGLPVSPQSWCACSPPRTQSRIYGFRCSLNLRERIFLFSSNPKIVSSGLQELPRFSLRCSGSTGDSGENESKTILDAFFLGKAVAEALNERLESAVGEFLSSIGRLQAEQQKQVQEFQDEVFERAKRTKEQAAREALGERKLPNPNAAEASPQNPGASDSPSDEDTPNED